jgi:hypothetical protein
MYTCYQCAKTITGPVKHTVVCVAAYRTGWNPQTGKAVDLDFPKAFHPTCYDKAEIMAAQALAATK